MEKQKRLVSHRLHLKQMYKQMANESGCLLKILRREGKIRHWDVRPNFRGILHTGMQGQGKAGGWYWPTSLAKIREDTLHHRLLLRRTQDVNECSQQQRGRRCKSPLPSAPGFIHNLGSDMALKRILEFSYTDTLIHSSGLFMSSYFQSDLNICLYDLTRVFCQTGVSIYSNLGFMLLPQRPSHFQLAH